MGFPGGTSGKELSCQCRRHERCSSIPGSGRSPGGGNGNPLQYSCLDTPPVDRGAWWAAVHVVAELDTTEVTEHAPAHRFSDMITYVKLTNIASSCSCLISLVMRAPKIYCLSRLSVFSRVLPTVVIMLYLRLLDIHLIYLQLCPLGQIISHSSHLSTHPSNHCSAPCFSLFDFLKLKYS